MRLPTKTTFLALASGLAIGAIFFSVIASAWTGPTATAPGSNVAAPLNVSSVNQTKNGNIGVNGLAVFGNTLLGGSAGSNAYLNFGATAGSGGYGIWDNNGTLNFKNSGGAWQSIQTTVSNLVSSLGQWVTSGSSIYYNGGNVGVGTTSPSQPLTVAGEIYTSSGGVEFPNGTVQTVRPYLTSSGACSSGGSLVSNLSYHIQGACESTNNGGGCVNYAYTDFSIGLCD